MAAKVIHDLISSFPDLKFIEKLAPLTVKQARVITSENWYFDIHEEYIDTHISWNGILQ